MLKTDKNITDLNMINDEELERKTKIRSFYDIYFLVDKFISFTYKTIIFLFKISGIYMLWICLHYFAAHLYIKFCVPNTLFGFIMSPLMISTPHCQGLRWIVYNAANIINNMWILVGTWISSMIWIMGNSQSST